MSSTEEIVINILKNSGCKSRETMIRPTDLFVKCKEEGVENQKEVEAAIVRLIDQDIVEYEMDDNLQTSELWLLEE